MNKAAAAALVAAVSGIIPAALPVAAQEQQSFKSIIGRGFEIRSVTFAKGDWTENREVAVVTLQREKSVAVCYFAATSWINLSNSSLDDPKRCDVR
jgi:hypothetical protein